MKQSLMLFQALAMVWRPHRWLFGVAVLVFVVAGAVLAQEAPTTPVAPTTTEDLQSQITERRQKVEELTRQAEAFEQTIQVKEREAFSLSREVGVIDDRLKQTEIEQESAETQIERIELEVQSVERQLVEKEAAIGDQQVRLGAYLRQLYRQQQRSMLEVAVVEDSLSSFVREVESLTKLQTDAADGLQQLKALRQDLRIAQEDLNGRRVELTQEQQRLSVLQTSLDDQRSYKATLLNQTQSSRAQFEQLLDDIRTDADAINAEIGTLEQRARAQLGQDPGAATGTLGQGPLAWPVDPGRGITAYFRDPTYPFRCTTKTQRNCIGEHAAIDIRVSQGTAVRAANDGYVAIARRLDWVRNSDGKIIRPAYNYVSLLHADGLSTVYGHLSMVSVVEDTYVKKGEVIGLSGALPGTAGAGVWTTGAHLHFEVRKDGIPVDPLGYLE